MPPRRSIFLHGLRLLVTNPGALLYTYALNLGIAVLFSLHLHAQLSSVLDRSLAAERLNSAFDLGTLLATQHRLGDNAPDPGGTIFLGIPVYLICYFILVPGTLFCYRTSAPSLLHILVGSGIGFFWRFVRITFLSGLTSLVILGPLLFLNNLWSTHIDETQVGLRGFVEGNAGLLVLFLVACILRLYFDLVECYTIQLADQFRPNGKQDRRIRRALLPALRALRLNLGRAFGTFVVLALFGLVAVYITGRTAAHTLAQPRVWPQFLLLQAGLFTLMATRFWQRGAETILAADFPLPPPPPLPGVDALYDENVIRYIPPAQPADAQSDPEPASPSLDEPDPGVFHHETGKTEEK